MDKHKGQDLRKSEFLNPVRNQLTGNCCFGFVTCACVEFLYNKHTKGRQKVTLAPQDLYDNLIRNHEEDKKGRNLWDAFAWMKDHGCVREESCPYRGGAFGPPAQDRQVIFKIKRTKYVTPSMMKGHLDNHGPVAVPLVKSWIKEMRNFTGAEIYNGPADASAYVQGPNNDVTSHALLVVGYGSEMVEGKLVEYWIVQNSYGEGWGQGGFAKFNMNIKDGNGDLLIHCGLAPEGITIPV